MDLSAKKEKKMQKRAYKKARRKATRPWKFLSILSGVLAVIMIIATVFV